MREKRYLCDPELQLQIEDAISRKKGINEEYYKEILRDLWREFKLTTESELKRDKEMAKIIEIMQQW